MSPPFFFFNDTATTEIYTLSLHDALPICCGAEVVRVGRNLEVRPGVVDHEDRKSTRLNSSHGYISYAVFCLKKKKKQHTRCSRTRTRTMSPRRPSVTSQT